MIPLPGAIIAGGAILKGIGAHQKKKAAESMKGPNLGKIRAELSPWKSKIDNMQSQSTSLMSEAQGMQDPRGQYQETQTQMLNERLGDQAQQQAQAQSQMMAQRGMGGGGIASLLAATQGAQQSEALRTGMAGIQQSGFDRSQQVRAQGMTLMNQAMNASQQYSENMVRAQEAKRQFANQRKMASGQATADMFSAAGDATLGMGAGALKNYDWSSLFKTKG